jgi:FkbM family methyltransferase
MSIRKLVIRLLRKYGAALTATVHDRLTTMESKLDQLGSKLNELNAQNEDLAASQTALLQGSIHLIESLQKLGAVTDSQQTFVQSWVDNQRQTLEAVIDLKGQVANSSPVRELRQTLEAVIDLKGHVVRTLENDVVQQVCVDTSDYNLINPEVGLLSFLYSYLPTRRVIDIGAHAGDVSEALLNAGYEVYAFEPSPAVYDRLVSRLGHRNEFHSFNLALGSVEGEMPLHSATDVTSANIYGDATLYSSLVSHSMPDGLRFAECTNVRVQTLESAHRACLVPVDAGLVKIDTEGFDLEVIRGMGEYRYPVVVTEYWDSKTPFGRSGLLYTLETLVAEMRSRGYFWYIVLYRLWGRNQIGYYCNYNRSLPNSWGNICFFRTYDLFAQAQMWCSASLPRIYFKPSLGVVAESGSSSPQKYEAN